jgi:hypothetical protein
VAATFADALRALNDLTAEGVVLDYAVAGGMAVSFWTEPFATYDIDVLVSLPPSAGPLVSLEPIYAWARRKGYPSRDEHIVIAGVPTQILPSPSALTDEAIREADTLDYDGVPVRVVRPEHLVAMFSVPEARTERRRARAAALMESPDLDRERLGAILRRHGLGP